MSRWNRIGITHQTLKCGTQILTRTPSLFPHKSAILPCNVEFMEKDVTYGRQKLGRPKEDEMEQVNTNAMIFMAASLKAAVHLGKDGNGISWECQYHDYVLRRTLSLRDSAFVLHRAEIDP